MLGLLRAYISEHSDTSKVGMTMLITIMHVSPPFEVPAQLSAEEVVQHA